MDEEDLLKKAYDDYEAGAYSPKLLKPADVDEVRQQYTLEQFFTHENSIL